MEPFYVYVYKAIHHTARKQEGLSVKNYEGSWEREDSSNWLKEGTSEHNSTNIGNLYKKCELALSLRSLGWQSEKFWGSFHIIHVAKQWGKNMDGE